jgi:hypothetical protein
MRWILPPLVIATLLLAGCGSSKKTTTSTAVHVLPAAADADEWAVRVVNLLLRPMNKDLQVLNNFNNPQVRVYIATRNETTLRIIRARMTDLTRCSRRLAEIGPPPAGREALKRIRAALAKACTDYAQVGDVLLRATGMLSSQDKDTVGRGEDLVRSARAPSQRAATNLVTAVRLAERQPAFRRAGLKGSF